VWGVKGEQELWGKTEFRKMVRPGEAIDVVGKYFSIAAYVVDVRRH